MKVRIAWAIVGMVLGAVLFQQFGQLNIPSIGAIHYITTAPEILEGQPPQRPPTIIERVVYKFPPAVTGMAPGGGIQALQSFCKPVSVFTTDTVKVDTQVLFQTGVINQSRWGKDQLTLVGFTNTGDLKQFNFYTRGSFSFAAVGDTAIVRYRRMNAVTDYVGILSDIWSVWSLIDAIR